MHQMTLTVKFNVLVSQITNFEGLNGKFKDTCDTETNLACSYSPHPKLVSVQTVSKQATTCAI